MNRDINNKPAWRLLDTGLRSGAENMALDAAILKARVEGSAPDTLRFLRFSPPVALVGYHQSVQEEIRTDYCREAGIDVNRRITGGGAIYFDEGQLGWELICSYKGLGLGLNLERITYRICEAAAKAMNALGVRARFRPRNDIEVDGRKISGTGGTFDGTCFLFQGTLLIDFNLENLIKALRIPTEKLNRRELRSAGERVTSLREQLGHVPPLDRIRAALADSFQDSFGFSLNPRGLTPREEELFRQELRKTLSDKWILGDRLPKAGHQILHSIYKEKGGLIRVAARVDVNRRILRDILITGDFFIRPKRAVLDLESALRGRRLDLLEDAVHEFFSTGDRSLLGLTPADFARAVRAAVGKLDYTALGLTLKEADTLTCVNGVLEEIISKCEVLLLPYCSKLPGCPLRFKDGCKKCGKCTIGEAYALGEAAGLRVKTIQNYEHLVEELTREREKGTRAYIGSCCEAFMVKRQEAFKNSGLPGLLLDIENTTCYELKLEDEAYRGDFKNQTHLRIPLLKKVLSAVRRIREAGRMDHEAA